MYWGEGSTLGLLTFLGYLVFVFGAAVVWRGRDEVSVWIHDEAGSVRRSFSRYTVIGPFYGPREDSRLEGRARSLRAFPAAHSPQPYRQRHDSCFRRTSAGPPRLFYLKFRLISFH
jgi:hypothetical protein